MKQTATEWLIDKLITENEVALKGENYKLFELAKEMEKEQIIKAAYDNMNAIEDDPLTDAKEYYNEKYGK